MWESLWFRTSQDYVTVANAQTKTSFPKKNAASSVVVWGAVGSVWPPGIAPARNTFVSLSLTRLCLHGKSAAWPDLTVLLLSKSVKLRIFVAFEKNSTAFWKGQRQIRHNSDFYEPDGVIRYDWWAQICLAHLPYPRFVFFAKPWSTVTYSFYPQRLERISCDVLQPGTGFSKNRNYAKKFTSSTCDYATSTWGPFVIFGHGW